MPRTTYATCSMGVLCFLRFIEWARALEIFNDVLALAEHCGSTPRSTNGHDIALCLLGVDTARGLAPQFWLLIQRISIRATWCFYTGHEYGDDIGPQLDTQPTGLCKMSVPAVLPRIASPRSGTHTCGKATPSPNMIVTSPQLIRQFNKTWPPLMCVRLPRKSKHNRQLAMCEPFCPTATRQRAGEQPPSSTVRHRQAPSGTVRHRSSSRGGLTKAASCGGCH